jgi:phosphatidylserine decarboxylase
MMSGVIAAWREVKAIVLSLIAAILLALAGRKHGLALGLTTVLGWIVYFFRDPERTPASFLPEAILAPADGRVTAIEIIDEPEVIQGRAWRMSVFLSLFDVHVQRCPSAGVLQFLRYQPGDFAPAFLKDTHRNEANLIGLETTYGLVGIKQIAGVLARRIVCWRQPGEKLSPGQRLGLIKFGSRVDLFLPLNKVEILIRVGEKTYGGQTVVARWINWGDLTT